MDDTTRLVLAGLAGLLLLAAMLAPWLKRLRVKARVKRLSRIAREITPGDLFRLRNRCKGRAGSPSIVAQCNFPGVYILTNYTKKKSYVGQAQKILDRVNQHFTGHGNGDVYADYKYGDRFTIRMIALKGSGFHNLNDLERHAIRTFGTVYNGYNRTRGNR